MAMNRKTEQVVKFKMTQRELEEDLKSVLQMGRIPVGWHELEGDPIEPHKTRVTIRLDTDMLRWFRKLGPQYQVRINKVLRLYFQGIVSGEIAIEEMVREDERKLEVYREEVRVMLGGERLDDEV